ncbi:hypothetical protein A6S26_14360 [Nostoc sp. ATCC 43529]|nr:hypothetical protein A6S26_14360 [Nostoc sp. ATCC 43529]
MLVWLVPNHQRTGQAGKGTTPYLKSEPCNTYYYIRLYLLLLIISVAKTHSLGFLKQRGEWQEFKALEASGTIFKTSS